jgi:HK97 family phage major capsid protein
MLNTPTDFATSETGETTIIAETEGLYGQIATTPKMLTIFSKVSRQLLIQSNVGQIVSQEQSASAATAVDAAVIGGTGYNGQPTGILATAGVGTFTGAALGYTSLVTGQQAVSDANAVLNPFTLGYLTTPSVAGLLKQRFRIATYGEMPLWQGALAGGNIEGVPAFSTRNVPANSMVYGDFSTVQVFMWDDVTIEVDPFSAFQTAQVGIRLILPYDVVLTYPAAFAIATGIT